MINILNNTANIEDIIRYLQDMQGINQKLELVNTIGSPTSANDNMFKIVQNIQGLKNTMASNLTNKRQNSTGTESLNNLINKIGNISLGKRWASGTISSFIINTYPSTLNIELGFKPNVIAMFCYDSRGIFVKFNELQKIIATSMFCRGAFWVSQSGSVSIKNITNTGFILNINVSTGYGLPTLKWLAYE